MTYIGILVSFIFVNNIILNQLLVGKGFLDVIQNIKTTLSYGILLVFIASLSCFFTWAVYNGILLPFRLAYLQTIVFIVIITTLTLAIEIVFGRISPELYRRIKDIFPLIAVNCAVLGICLIAVRSGYTAAESLIAGAAAGTGYFLAVILLAAIQESMKKEWIPQPLRGIPITLISAGLMALAFMAFDEALLKNLM